MKNLLFIDLDTDRDNQIIFGKPQDFVDPQTQSEAAEMMMNDIITLTHGLASLIFTASENGFANKSDLINSVLISLEDLKKLDNPDGHKETT